MPIKNNKANLCNFYKSQKVRLYKRNVVDVSNPCGIAHIRFAIYKEIA